MNNIASLTFASTLGVAVYTPLCDLAISGTMTPFNGYRFASSLQKFKAHRHIDLAIVQAFGPIPAIHEPHLEAVKTVFPEHILVHHDQWNPTCMSPRSRRLIAETLLAEKISSQHQVDAILQGKWLYDILRSAGIPFPADYLAELSRTTRRFPRRYDLRQMQGRMLQEAVHAN